ncbi:hypothetical protein PQX77_001515 [Marasmius sp. AFHP31]|nr:hypothetical protein PQX77_001515 [Marasmius sp. AFHP31]
MTSAQLSEISNLLRQTVTSSDRDTVSRLLHNTEQELRGCDAEINRLRIAMQSLENRKEGLKNTVERYRSLLSPIRRLPAEILAHIFSFACTRNEIGSDPPPAFRLSMVCGHWRDVALSTAGLWSSLFILFVKWQNRFPALRRVVLMFMERSGVHPLHLSLSVYIKSNAKANMEMQSVVDVLTRSCSRWEEVMLASFTEASCLDALLRYNGSFPALQKVQVVTLCDPSRLLNLFRCSTSLHTLSVTLSRLSGDVVHSIDLPWNQIKTLQISTVHPSPVLSLLTKLPRLETLDLSSIPNDEVHFHHTSHTIKSLALRYNSPGDDGRAMLKHLTIPNLSALEIKKCWPDTVPTRSWGSSIADFLTRSGCSLTSLRLNEVSLYDQQLIALLELTPTLTTLEIEEWQPMMPEDYLLTGTFLRRFIVVHQPEALHPGRRILLPRLTDIVFKVVQKEGLVEQDFFDLVASRWIPDPDRAREIGVECLRSVRITMVKGNSTASNSEYTLSTLECFRDAGLWVEVGTSDTDSLRPGGSVSRRIYL